jgi:hypothetical protein
MTIERANRASLQRYRGGEGEEDPDPRDCVLWREMRHALDKLGLDAAKATARASARQVVIALVTG